MLGKMKEGVAYWYLIVFVYSPIHTADATQPLASTPPGCLGHIPPIFWLSGTSMRISPHYYYIGLQFKFSTSEFT